MAGTLDSFCQLTLLAFGKTGLLTSLDLSVLVHIPLQGLEILVVEVWNVCSMFKNLCHFFLICVIIFAGHIRPMLCSVGLAPPVLALNESASTLKVTTYLLLLYSLLFQNGMTGRTALFPRATSLSFLSYLVNVNKIPLIVEF